MIGNSMFFLRELWRFIRLETCLYITGMAASGFLLFSGMGPGLLPLLAATFFLTAASYSYNQFTDEKEDSINNGGLNLFVKHSRIGIFVTLLCLSISLYSVMLIPSVLHIYIIIMVLALCYSGLRVKRILILKNLFTGSVIALAFLFGAGASHPITSGVMMYYIFITTWAFAGNLIGDLRGMEGDRIVNLRTMPIAFGYQESRLMVYLLYAFLIAFMVIFNMVPLFFTIPFAVLTLFYVARNDMKTSRYIFLSAFAALPLLILLVM